MMIMMKIPTQLSSHRPAHRPEVRYLWRRRGLLPPRVGFGPNTTPNQTLYPQRPQKRPPTPHIWSKLKDFLETSAKVLEALLKMFELKRGELKTEDGPCLHDHREQSSQDVLVLGGVRTMSFSRMGRPMSRLNGRERANFLQAWRAEASSLKESRAKSDGRKQAQVVARDPKRISQARQEIQGPRGTKE